MEFHEKLQELRKSRGLTQEELAEVLYVSRTAISKWESGRGYPSIDSLRAIADFFKITVDDLLSGNELLTAAQEDNKQKEGRVRDLVFGLLDCSIAMLFFLPFFGQGAEGGIKAVSLLSLTAVAPYLQITYLVTVTLIILTGILTLAFQGCQRSLWVQSKHKISLILTAFAALLFVLSLQPYAATLVFVFLAVKVLTLIKWQ